MAFSPKIVIFDLDGTLLNTAADLGGAVEHILRSRGLPGHTEEEYKSFVGHGVRNLVKSALPAELREDSALVDALLADFKKYYFDNIAVRTVPYPGIDALLHELQARGVKMAVASNKFQAGTSKLISLFFPDIEFAAVVGNREGLALKPDPAVVDFICEESGCSKEEVLFVGDSETDILTAKAAGVPCIAVNWGFRSRAENLAAGAAFLADTVDQLRKFIY